MSDVSQSPQSPTPAAVAPGLGTETTTSLTSDDRTFPLSDTAVTQLVTFANEIGAEEERKTTELTVVKVLCNSVIDLAGEVTRLKSSVPSSPSSQARLLGEVERLTAENERLRTAETDFATTCACFAETCARIAESYELSTEQYMRFASAYATMNPQEHSSFTAREIAKQLRSIASVAVQQSSIPDATIDRLVRALDDYGVNFMGLGRYGLPMGHADAVVEMRFLVRRVLAEGAPR